MSEFIEILSSQSKKDLDEFINKLEQGVDLVNKINKEGIKVVSPSESKKSIEGINKEIQKSNKLKTEAEKLDISLQRANERLNATRSKSGRELQKVRVEQTAVNRAAKEEATLNSSLIGAYQKLNLQRTQASRRLRDLLASEKASNAEIRRAQDEFNKLDQRVRKADMAVRDHTKNVGNYRSALGGLGGSLRSLMGAFGMIGGVYLFARALRDAFSRVREFDKAMQNLTGIFGTSRDELRDLEIEIKAVAGSSVNTSNQVANLATAMVALGKTKREVIQLLKPVNDLSIALGSSAEATGEFLIQTLNAFGKGAESGEEFANIIAKVRTSTALDFERIQIAMGYLAPVANALNMTLEETSAILGVLVDNGIKAQRAGRLMGSAFGRLAQNGMTLEQALAQINASQDKLVTSTELFGAEAGTLGLILASNTEKVKEYTKSFEDASGSLDKLTNEQLKSMDAQLKILDSTWESLILSFESGQGQISRVFATITSYINKALSALIEFNTSLEDKTISAVKNTLNEIREEFGELNEEELTAKVQIRAEEAKEEINVLGKRLAHLMSERAKWINLPFGLKLKRQSEETSIEISKLTEKLKIYEEILKTGVIPSTNDLVSEIEEINKATKESNEVIKGSISWFKQQISELERKRDALALTGLELQKYNEKIANLKDSLEKLERSGRLVSDMLKRIEADSEMPNFTLPGKIDDGRRKAEQFQKTLERLKHQYQDTFGTLPPILGVNFDSFGTLFFGLQFGFESAGEAAQAFGQIAIETFRSVMEMQNMALENQIRNLEAQRNVEIEFAGGSAAARGEIEERFQKRKAELQKKQAENNKKSAIVESIIGTAVAVVKALPNILLAKIVGALGAAQTAIIAAQPIPQFAEGVRNFEGGKAIVGDGGKREPITDKSGRLIGISPAKSTLVDLPKGANVYSSEADFYRELNKMLGSNNIIPIPQGDSLTEEEIYNAMKKAIGNLPSNETVIDKNGFTTFIFKGMNKKKILNNRVTFKGKNI